MVGAIGSLPLTDDVQPALMEPVRVFAEKSLKRARARFRHADMNERAWHILAPLVAFDLSGSAESLR